LADASKAVALKPDGSNAHLHKGTALILLERYAEAEDVFLAGLGVEPSSEPLQVCKAGICMAPHANH
jgi:hypothetical protein